MTLKRRIFHVCLAVVIMINIMNIPVSALESSDNGTPRASYYLDSYNTYIYPDAFGEIQVWFKVIGVDYMDDIGALSIQIYESKDQTNWTWVKTYRHEATSGMLGYDKIYHSGHVDYQGTIGCYYKAYVCIWAGKDGAGDTRYMWTQPKKATLFAG